MTTRRLVLLSAMVFTGLGVLGCARDVVETTTEAVETAVARTDGPTGTSGMVASAHRRATEAGVEILDTSFVQLAGASRANAGGTYAAANATITADGDASDDALHVLHARQLDNDAVVALALDGRLRHAELIDAIADNLLRLGDRVRGRLGFEAVDLDFEH